MNDRALSIIKWEPVPDIPSQLYLSVLQDNSEELTIQLQVENSDRILVLRFSSYVSYRNTDEPSRLKSLNEAKILGGSWPLFMTDDSEYISWVVTESHGITQKDGLNHFILTLGSGIIDILSHVSPEVFWSKN